MVNVTPEAEHKPRILVIDIETMAALGHFWRIFKENIGIEQILAEPRMICFAAQWLGEKEVQFYSEWEDGHQEMVDAAYALLEEADAVIGFNHKRFDMPHLWTEFIKHGYDSPPSIPTNIDLQQILRTKFRFISNKLAFVGPALKIGAKVKHEGFELWLAVNKGCPKAQKRMKRYCKQDVRLTTRLYNKLAPWITNHPHIGHKGTCGKCGSSHAQKRGFRYTPTMRVQRLKCNNCSSWYSGKREKMI